MTEDKYPIIHLPGSEKWESSYDWGYALGEKFPDQCASDFALASTYNDLGPAEQLRIVGFVMEQEGENDGQSWIWQVTFEDGSVWIADGSCDYTGWDCQSSIAWTLDHHVDFQEEFDAYVERLVSGG
jgi:hypothetical protein